MSIPLIGAFLKNRRIQDRHVSEATEIAAVDDRGSGRAEALDEAVS